MRPILTHQLPFLLLSPFCKFLPPSLIYFFYFPSTPIYSLPFPSFSPSFSPLIQCNKAMDLKIPQHNLESPLFLSLSPSPLYLSYRSARLLLPSVFDRVRRSPQLPTSARGTARSSSFVSIFHFLRSPKPRPHGSLPTRGLKLGSPAELGEKAAPLAAT